jgi:hypothetical protein
MPPDEPATPVADAAPVAVPEPVAIEAAATPVAEVVAEPVAAPPETPVETPVAPVLHTDTPTLLEAAGKPAETPQTAEAASAAPATPTPAPRTYEAFTFPEGITADDKQLATYQDIAGRHNLDQETAQSLLNMHTGSLKQYAENLLSEQHRVFGETRKAWRDSVMGDEELGGAGHQTAMAAVARMRDLLVPAERMAAFNDMLRMTGVGDHPEFNRLLHAAARFFDEPAAPTIVAQPSPDRGGNAGRGAGSRRGVLYDHPSSNRARG